MVAVEFYNHPLFVGAVLAFLSSVVGYLAYRRAKSADRVAKETGTIGAVYEGFNIIIRALRADNDELRARVGRIDDLEADVRKLLDRVAKLERYIAGEGLPIPENGGKS